MCIQSVFRHHEKEGIPHQLDPYRQTSRCASDVVEVLPSGTRWSEVEWLMVYCLQSTEQKDGGKEEGNPLSEQYHIYVYPLLIPRGG